MGKYIDKYEGQEDFVSMPFQTENKNFQSQFNFDLRIHKMPHVNFNVQRVELPGVSICAVKSPTQFNAIHFPGDEVTYNTLNVEFKVQEGMRDWYEIFQWIISSASPEKYTQYEDLKKGRLKDLDGKTRKFQNNNPTRPLDNLFSEVTLIVNTSKENPYFQANFVDVFPLSISDLIFNTTDSQISYISAVARFQYDTYNITLP